MLKKTSQNGFQEDEFKDATFWECFTVQTVRQLKQSMRSQVMGIKAPLEISELKIRKNLKLIKLTNQTLSHGFSSLTELDF